MGKMSVQKGSSFERKIVGMYNEKFAGFCGVDTPFYRSPHSGSYWGGKNRHRLGGVTSDNQKPGDIIGPDDFRFVTECKHWKTPPSFKQFVLESPWTDFIGQASGDAHEIGRSWVLIVKYNLVPEVAVLNVSFADQFRPLVTHRVGGFIVIELKEFLSKEPSWYFVK